MITSYRGMGFFGAFPIMFFVVFALAALVIAVNIAQNLRRHRENRSMPKLTAEATVVARRTHVWGDHSHTDYYATFQFPSGDRLELEVPQDQFGYLVEDDRGDLTYQGTWFLAFNRK